MKILLINAHPDYQNTDRTINQLVQVSLQTIARVAPTADVEQLTLYNPKNTIPPITADVMNHPERVADTQQALIEQWKRADVILIMMPLHNFNVVSKLKDYIDNIFVAKQTFKYTADGSVGLLDGHQKVAYIQSSGSDYEHDLRYVNADFAPHYLRTILNFMGITKMTLIRAEGLDLIENDKPAIVAQTKRELTAYLTATLG
ncbi:FMN-dependent NADH-azoreductase [Lactiplantibacillus songbeiensis]|uniref:FMN dependent NADH:quinone oxidoreductase n=1 Tax=Lactiplantibacillus songbeiensis TaxID=2559920 RepID=A0ABW4BZX4_9LACO|nr:NAD(P)H-dependent oxidoreductase [Lactiplantibacillus songbeiensis]